MSSSLSEQQQKSSPDEAYFPMNFETLGEVQDWVSSLKFQMEPGLAEHPDSISLTQSVFEVDQIIPPHTSEKYLDIDTPQLEIHDVVLDGINPHLSATSDLSTQPKCPVDDDYSLSSPNRARKVEHYDTWPFGEHTLCSNHDLEELVSTDISTPELHKIPDPDSISPSHSEDPSLLFPKDNDLSVARATSVPPSVSHIQQEYHGWASESELIPSNNIMRSPGLLHGSAEDKQTDEAMFTQLFPLLKTVEKSNFESFLVKIVKECHHIPMEDLYNLLYNDKRPDFTPSVPDSILPTDPSYLLRQRGIKLCHLVLESFKNPGNPPCARTSQAVQIPTLSSVSFHELLRTFLAIKLLSDTLKVVDHVHPGGQSLPRVSVYKVYYMICQKLIAKYPTSSHSTSIQQNIILGQPQLGKLTRLVFPTVTLKRLGRRGESLPHYIGLTWKEDTVSQEMLDMIGLSVREIQEAFKDSRRSSSQKRTRGEKCEAPTEMANPKQKQMKRSGDTEIRTKTDLSRVYQTPLKSFVHLSCTHPNFNCSPRIWHSDSSLVPQQSKWAEDTMYRSVKVLNGYKINLNPLIQNFNRCNYSDTSLEGLSRTIIEALKTLVAASPSCETYMHLYLAILLLLFPAILASDQEVALPSKLELRASVKHCLTEIEYESAFASIPNLATFTGILQNMLKLNELTSTTIQGSSPECILEEIAKDVKYTGGVDVDQNTVLSSLEESYSRVAIIAFNAYEYNAFAQSPSGNQHDSVDVIPKIARTFAKTSMAFADRMQSIPALVQTNGSKHVTPDIPHQIFQIGVEILHEHSLKNPLVAQLPIPIVNAMMAKISSDVQNFSFDQFRKRGSESSKEIFKSWWVFSSMFQEYLGIMSEVLALSQRLA